MFSLKIVPKIGRVMLNVLCIVTLIPTGSLAQESGENSRQIIEVLSSVDGTRQPSHLHSTEGY